MTAAIRTASKQSPDLLVDREGAAGSETLLSTFLFHFILFPLPLLQNALKAGKRKVTHFHDRHNKNHAWLYSTYIYAPANSPIVFI